MRKDVGLFLWIGTVLAAAALWVVADGMFHQALAETNTIKYHPTMTMKSLADRPDADRVELSNGRRMSLGDLRKLEAAGKKMAAPLVDRLPTSLKIKPGATGTLVRNSADLASALKRPDNATIQLPSGRLVTVGQIKFVQAYVEKKVGHPLTEVPKRPNLTGPVVKVPQNATKTQWDEILKKPDSTVLESPHGKKITVGELKDALAKGMVSLPTSTPRKAPQATPASQVPPAAAPMKR
jgi:hypothetical protein